TDAGAVALGIESAEALERAATDMRAAVAWYSERAVTDLFLVEPMARAPLAELVVGIRRDAQFGLAMTLGSGGILVELLGDTVTLLLPSTRAEIAAALESLKLARLLDGYRGGASAEKAAVVAALHGLAQHAMAHRESLVEIEINPLFVYENSVLAVDVLMQLDAD
ncbi:MAG: acetate--CoA ligase family protein, partial [Pseudomonadota bacterium]